MAEHDGDSPWDRILPPLILIPIFVGLIILVLAPLVAPGKGL